MAYPDEASQRDLFGALCLLCLKRSSKAPIEELSNIKCPQPDFRACATLTLQESFSFPAVARIAITFNWRSPKATATPPVHIAITQGAIARKPSSTLASSR